MLYNFGMEYRFLVSLKLLYIVDVSLVYDIPVWIPASTIGGWGGKSVLESGKSWNYWQRGKDKMFLNTKKLLWNVELPKCEPCLQRTGRFDIQSILKIYQSCQRHSWLLHAKLWPPPMQPTNHLLHPGYICEDMMHTNTQCRPIHIASSCYDTITT